MSKIDELAGTITHWKDGEQKLSIATNFYVFREAQATCTATYYDKTTWEWNGGVISMQGVGVRPYQLKWKGELTNSIELIHFSISFDHPSIIRELEKESWIEVSSYRSVLANPTSPILNEMLEFIESAAVREQIASRLHLQTCTVSVQYFKDMPGYSEEPHFDNNTILASGIIYFTKDSNADVATTFCEDNVSVLDNTKFCNGAIYINNVLHSSNNNSNQIRYTMQLRIEDNNEYLD